MRPTRLAHGGFWALGGLVGPAAFIGAWVVGGVVASDYSPVDDAISELASVDASTSTRVLMTAGFVVYGIGVGAYAVALRKLQPGRAWAAAATSAACTLGVAATPLDWSSAIDTVHGAFAGTGYVALAAVPLLSVPYLSSSRWRAGAVVAGVVAGACLAATLAGDAHGFFQRAGLTAGDLWLMASALALARARSATVIRTP